MSEPHQRLAQAMERRGEELGKRWVQIAREAGVTTSALGAIRRGEYQPSAHTARGIEDALEWEYGSIRDILEGGDPTQRADNRPSPDPGIDETLAEVAVEWADLREKVNILWGDRSAKTRTGPSEGHLDVG